MAEEKEAPEPGRRLHVTVLLVASRRALDNALGELGFAEDDDRIIEHDGRLAFLTCTHEDDCDDLFAFINTAMVMGLIPVVGVPLPLISYGGTAMVTVMLGFGLLMNVGIHRDVRISRQGESRIG